MILVSFMGSARALEERQTLALSDVDAGAVAASDVDAHVVAEEAVDDCDPRSGAGDRGEAVACSIVCRFKLYIPCA